MSDALRRDHHRHRRRRRHARPPARAVRQAHPAARARRLPAARAGELGRRRRSSARSATSRPSGGTTSTAQPFRPHAQYYVGGNTKVYGAILFRLRERDFGEVRHYGGVSPAWPISYDDLEPYYAEAERLYLVHGAGGRGPHRAASAPGPFPYPAVSHEPRIQQLHDDLARAGLHPFHLPVGVDLNESDPEKGRCVRCAKFDGFPCLTDGKADAHVRCVRPALAHDNVTLRTHSKVCGSRPTHAGGTVDGRRRRARRPRGDVLRRRRRRLVRRRELRRTAAALGERQAPERARQLVRRRRPPLHGAHQLGGDRDLADRRTRRSSRRRSGSTTTTGAPTTSSSRSATSRCSASRTRTSCGPARPGSHPGSRSTTWRGTRSTSG